MAWGDAMAAIAAGRTRTVDLGLATGGTGTRAFGIAAFVGAATQMAGDAGVHGKPLRGVWGYLPYLANAARFRSAINVETDGGNWCGRALSVQVANSPTGGGGIRVCPPASMDDGLLDVVVVEAVPLPRIARLLAAITRGRHLDLPFVHHWACRTATLTGQDVPLALDGEITGELPAHLTVAPAALRVVVADRQPICDSEDGDAEPAE
jgi:diacylglycerol kinase (ATP)